MLDCYKKLARFGLRRVFWLHAVKNLLFAAAQIWLFHFFDCQMFSLMVFSNYYFSLRIDLSARMELYEERYRTRNLPLTERLENASFEAGMWKIVYNPIFVQRRVYWAFYLVFPLVFHLCTPLYNLFSNPLDQLLRVGTLLVSMAAAVCLNWQLLKITLSVITDMQQDVDTGLDEMNY